MLEWAKPDFLKPQKTAQSIPSSGSVKQSLHGASTTNANARRYRSAAWAHWRCKMHACATAMLVATSPETWAVAENIRKPLGALLSQPRSWFEGKCAQREVVLHQPAPFERRTAKWRGDVLVAPGWWAFQWSWDGKATASWCYPSLPSACHSLKWKSSFTMFYIVLPSCAFCNLVPFFHPFPHANSSWETFPRTWASFKGRPSAQFHVLPQLLPASGLKSLQLCMPRSPRGLSRVAPWRRQSTIWTPHTGLKYHPPL